MSSIEIATLRDKNLNPHVVDVTDFDMDDKLGLNLMEVHYVPYACTIEEAQKYCDKRKTIGLYDSYNGILVTPLKESFSHVQLLNAVIDLQDNVSAIYKRFVLLAFKDKYSFELYVKDFMYHFDVKKYTQVTEEEYLYYLEYVLLITEDIPRLAPLKERVEKRLYENVIDFSAR